ncbi:hypothetical protein ACFVTM_16305 [Arthrobacter sp. NPDC058130]|uniref:hypothetical protein n=1 Tax=Arthrobacter sp. NPDC058130 TaxID=3346353 RepID=UPI0036E1866E
MRNPLQNTAASHSDKSAGDTESRKADTKGGPQGSTPGSAGRAAASLAELVRYRTVSRRAEVSPRADGSRRADGEETAEFEAFIAALSRLYPAIHAALDLERVYGHALLYRWPGSALAEDPAAATRPSVLMAHYDVVPPGDPGEWTQPPFSGHNDGTLLWRLPARR